MNEQLTTEELTQVCGGHSTVILVDVDKPGPDTADTPRRATSLNDPQPGGNLVG
jgi:hypothetical protein